MAADIVDRVRKRLKHDPYRWEPGRWLDTGFPALNRVIGHREKGIPYGRIFEISGLQSHGKTAVALGLAAAAQSEGAQVIWADFENTWDRDWVKMRGVDPDSVWLFQPYVGKFPGESDMRMISGQELCAEVEEAMKTLPMKKDARAILFIDSVAAITTIEELQAGADSQTMRTRMGLPMFLSSLLRTWVGLAQVHNVSICLINQLREQPMAFGDPYYTPGGRAIEFYSHVRVRLRRKKRLKSKTREVGLEGEMSAVKNKIGGVQGSTIRYRLRTDTGELEFFE